MAKITATLDEFYIIFPQFNTEDYAPVCSFYFNDTMAWAADNWELNIFKTRLNYAIYLMTAHRSFLNKSAQTAQAGQGGKVASASVGEVSVTYETIPNLDKLSYWLSLSPYGLELLGLLETLSTVPQFYGGSLEKVF